MSFWGLLPSEDISKKYYISKSNEQPVHLST